MPCRCDGFPTKPLTKEQQEESYRNSQYEVDLKQRMNYLEKTDFLLFGVPLAGLLCETCKKLIELNQFDAVTQDLKDWWEEHNLRDIEQTKRPIEEVEEKYTKLHKILLRNMYPNYTFTYFADVQKMVHLKHYGTEA